MTTLTKEQGYSRERTLLIALLLSIPGPLVAGFAVISSQSTTQLADLIRRSVELIALFLSWWVFRQIQRNLTLNEEGQSQLERVAGMSVAAAMICSGFIMLAVALSRWSVFEPGGNVLPGLTIAALGFLVNSWFWRRYTVLTNEKYSTVIATQQALYRAKTSVDLGVVIALVAVAVAPAHPVTPYIDISGSIAVAGYLLWSGMRMARSHWGDFKRLPKRI